MKEYSYEVERSWGKQQHHQQPPPPPTTTTITAAAAATTATTTTTMNYPQRRAPPPPIPIPVEHNRQRQSRHRSALRDDAAMDADASSISGKVLYDVVCLFSYLLTRQCYWQQCLLKMLTVRLSIDGWSCSALLSFKNDISKLNFILNLLEYDLFKYNNETDRRQSSKPTQKNFRVCILVKIETKSLTIVDSSQYVGYFLASV